MIEVIVEARTADDRRAQADAITHVLDDSREVTVMDFLTACQHYSCGNHVDCPSVCYKD